MKKIYFNKKIEELFLISTIIFSAILQIFLVPKLPDKYFYDSNNILEIVLDKPSINYDGSYMFAGNFFKAINIFNFSTFTQWSIVITILMSTITFIFLIKFNHISIGNLIFVYSIIVFLNIYIYRISKDFIQMIFFILVYIVAVKRNISYKNKIILISFIFIIEANLFRGYYIIVATLFIFFTNLFNNSKSINYKKLSICIFSGLIVSLFILQAFRPDIFLKIINMRVSLNGGRLDSVDAVTQINDVFYNSNSLMYTLNYFINLIRILFPIELCLKGVKYIPFIIFQVYLSINILRKLKNINYSNKTMKILMSIIISYILVSNLYEPDFGSFIRHEVALYFIIISIVLFDCRIWREKNETCILNNVS